jgi:hypothetical protein
MLSSPFLCKGQNSISVKLFFSVSAQEFEMTDLGLMSYFLGLEIKQRDKGIFVSQEGYAKGI